MKVCRRCGQNMALRTGLTCPGHTTGCHEWEEVNNKTEKPMTTAPAWHDKPTEPGLWLVKDKKNGESWTAEVFGVDLNNGSWKHGGVRVWGPIPPDVRPVDGVR